MNPADGFSFVVQPDLKKVSELICKTWARPCWNYDTGLLQLHINRPSGDPTLAIAQADGDGTLASFQAYMPFDVEYYGQKYRSVFASFLTVSGDFQGRGLAGPQQGALIEAAIEKNYDLYITMCEVGAFSNIAVEKIFGKKGMKAKIVNVLNYLASPREIASKVLPENASGKTRPYSKSDKSAIVDMVGSLGQSTSLRKLIPEDDLNFLFADRAHTKTWVYEKDGDIKGLINILTLEVLDVDDTKLNVYFDNIAIDGLSEDEQIEFIGDIMLEIQALNYHTAFVPNTGYAPVDVFRKFRFRIAPRQINLYVIPLKDNILKDGAKEVGSFFMDVY
ncbi:MAG: hypothetical protein KAR42_14215 [candidate division Zixibacteria bacterium]|nr:hypothetical protein [candidate division Zixibacteria bacterium]